MSMSKRRFSLLNSTSFKTPKGLSKHDSVEIYRFSLYPLTLKEGSWWSDLLWQDKIVPIGYQLLFSVWGTSLVSVKYKTPC